MDLICIMKFMEKVLAAYCFLWDLIILVLGLLACTTNYSWLSQVEEFGRDDGFTVMVLDNRGFPNSDAPFARYTTGDMALDVMDVLNYVGWTEDNSVHLIGVSMGGMISLEIANYYPERLASLMLLSTSAGELSNFPPLNGLLVVTRSLVESLLGIDLPNARTHRIVSMLFPRSWLDEERQGNTNGITNAEYIEPIFNWRSDFSLRPTIHGVTSQVFACMTHHVSGQSLQDINRNIPKIAIHTGDCE